MVRTVCLDEAQHAIQLLREVKKLKETSTHCDFIIKVGNDEYPAHKAILSAASPYFEAMLRNKAKETTEGIADMSSHDAECVKSCLEFIYTGKFDIPDRKIYLLLKVAHEIDLKDMTDAISDILIELLNVENFFGTKETARIYQFEALTAKCEDYFCYNIYGLSYEPGFEKEEKNSLLNALISKKCDLSEEEKLEVCLRWALEETDKKRAKLHDLLRLIKLHEVSREHVEYLLNKDPVVSNDAKLRKKFGRLLRKSTVSSASVAKNVSGIERRERKKERSGRSIIVFDEDHDRLCSYDPMTDKVAVFHHEKYKHLGKFSAACLDSYIYALCGNKEVHRLNWIYKNSSWERMPDTIVDHGRRPSLIAFNDALFIIGGIGKEYEAIQSVEKFDSRLNEWTQLDDKPSAIAGVALVTCSEKIYCIGGRDKKYKDSKAFTSFNPSSNHWNELTPMSDGRSYCSAVAAGYKIYAMAGYKKGTIQLTAESYDMNTKEWTALLGLMRKRHDETLKLYDEDDHIFMIASGYSDEVVKYNIQKGDLHRATMKGRQRFRIGYSVSLFL